MLKHSLHLEIIIVLAFSPFSIESTNEPEKEPIGKTYNILNQLTPLITKYQSAGTVKGFLIEKDSIQKDIQLVIIFLQYIMNIKWDGRRDQKTVFGHWPAD